MLRNKVERIALAEGKGTDQPAAAVDHPLQKARFRRWVASDGYALTLGMTQGFPFNLTPWHFLTQGADRIFGGWRATEIERF